MNTPPTKESVWKVAVAVLTLQPNVRGAYKDAEAEYVPDFTDCESGYTGPAIRTRVSATTLGAVVAHCAAGALHEEGSDIAHQTFEDAEDYIPQNATPPCVRETDHMVEITHHRYFF